MKISRVSAWGWTTEDDQRLSTSAPWNQSQQKYIQSVFTFLYYYHSGLRCLSPRVQHHQSPVQVFFKPFCLLLALTPRSYSVTKMVCFSFLSCQTRQSDIDVNLLVRSSQPNERSENRLFIPFQWLPKPPTCNTVGCIINRDEKTRGDPSSNLTEKCHFAWTPPVVAVASCLLSL